MFNRLSVGGLGIDGRVQIGVTVQTDAGFTPLRLTVGRAPKLFDYQELALAPDPWFDATCTVDPEMAARLWNAEIAIEAFSMSDIPGFRIAACCCDNDGEFPAVREKHLPIQAGFNEFRLSVGDLAPLRGILTPENFNSLRIGGVGVDGDVVRFGIRFVDNNQAFPPLTVEG